MKTLPKLQKRPEVQRGKADKIANVKRTGRRGLEGKIPFPIGSISGKAK